MYMLSVKNRNSSWEVPSGALDQTDMPLPSKSDPDSRRAQTNPTHAQTPRQRKSTARSNTHHCPILLHRAPITLRNTPPS